MWMLVFWICKGGGIYFFKWAQTKTYTKCCAHYCHHFLFFLWKNKLNVLSREVILKGTVYLAGFTRHASSDLIPPNLFFLGSGTDLNCNCRRKKKCMYLDIVRSKSGLLLLLTWKWIGYESDIGHCAKQIGYSLALRVVRHWKCGSLLQTPRLSYGLVSFSSALHFFSFCSTPLKPYRMYDEHI